MNWVYDLVLGHPANAKELSYGGSSHDGEQAVPLQTNKGFDPKGFLLHGRLEFWVKEAKNLPNKDKFHKGLVDMATGRVGRKSDKITSDPYVKVSVSGAVIGRTFVKSDSENPVWRQHFNVLVAHYAAEVQFVVKDSDVVGSQFIGEVRIPMDQVCYGMKVEGTFPILNKIGEPCNDGAVLSLSIQYTPLDKGTLCQEVPGTYFPIRSGNKVTLYQDAHVHDDFLPNLKLDGGVEYKHENCWHDIFDAISEARHFIYIAGWSVYHKVRLVRDNQNETDSTLGDLLKTKSRTGVRVVLLVWDDPTSTSILGYKKNGVMDTHDEHTRHFFKHSSVNVLLCPRSAGRQYSLAKQGAEKIYSHHQKIVIVDADAGHQKRKIIAFIGGLDLGKGRYDTPKHPIFGTSQTEHKDDYHNPNFTEHADGCPRQPWHDLHCQIDGPAAYDILNNFENRWLKVSKPHGLKKLKADILLEINRFPEIIGMADVPCLSDQDDPEAWNVQVFRSIDSSSVKGFLEEDSKLVKKEDPKLARCQNLLCGKNKLIDKSIHTAYVTAIRAAQNFVYIENQYFVGSSYNWDYLKDLGANNLIPMEIALKIVNKIKANERFSAYIVIPMWPEGVPTKTITQQQLYWQRKTMQMMYRMIYSALKEKGLENKYEPQDYLNFFCLGNREAPDMKDNSVSNARKSTTEKTPQVLSQESRRFMIYVHSKGMIVDDEYVILGSANINQRSMKGTGDTEIAMGAYQPHHTCRARKLSSPHGQVYGYRMSLWAEHIGGLEECFKQPESLECVRRVRSLGELNWRQYAADEVTEMKGHLLKYPLEVDQMGEVKPLPGCESFPDVGGNVTGTISTFFKNLTI